MSTSTAKPPVPDGRPPQRRAAVAAAAGFLVIATFQVALALGAPLGRAAWGGTYSQLPTSLRIGSAIAVVVWLLATLVVLRRAGFRVVVLPVGFVRWGTWIIVGLSFLGALVNFASPSPWERFLWGPIALVLAVLCVMVARGGLGTDHR